MDDEQKEKVVPRDEETVGYISDIVKEINDDILEYFDGCVETDDIYQINVELLTNGDIVLVNLCGIELWSNENDYRDEIDTEKEIYEPLEQYIRKRVMDFVELIGKIKI
jgi:hypothetical protein